MSPAELLAWCEAANGEEDNIFEELYGGLDEGEEVID